MNAAIFRKTLRETTFTLGLLLVTILIFEQIFVFAISQFASEMIRMWSRFPFILKLVQTLLGADLKMDPSTTAFITLGFSHPFLFAVSWAFIISTCTRITVAEIDRGTADLLLTLPTSRAGVYAAVTLVWTLIGLPICAMPWLGIRIASSYLTLEEPPDMARLWLPVVNLYALYLAIGCVTMSISTMHSRRAPAVTVVLAILLASFIVNFLVALVPSMHWLGYVGILHYYRPLESVRTAALQWGDLAVLLGVALAAWLGGMWVFCRRDIPAA